MKNTVKLLDSNQTQSFDTEYVDDYLFSIVVKAVDQYLTNIDKGEVIDVGGGNGMFIDRVLDYYPNFSATLVEPESTLLHKNSSRDNKKLIESTFQDFPESPKSTDLITLNWVLHHFVGCNYSNTYQLQLQALKKCYNLLKPGGIVFIFENFYEGKWVNDMPGSIIYHLTASSLMKEVTKKLGANTAGVGVSFHSRNTWINMLKESGFQIESAEICYPFGELSHAKKIALGLSGQYVGLIVGKKPPNLTMV